MGISWWDCFTWNLGKSFMNLGIGSIKGERAQMKFWVEMENYGGLNHEWTEQSLVWEGDDITLGRGWGRSLPRRFIFCQKFYQNVTFLQEIRSFSVSILFHLSWDVFFQAVHQCCLFKIVNKLITITSEVDNRNSSTTLGQGFVHV